VETQLRTYTFRVVVEPDEDRWIASCPALEPFGATTWGYSREEAFKNIQELVQMVVEELLEDGIAIPGGPSGDVEVLAGAHVAVTV